MERSILEERLAALKEEFEAGQKLLAEQESRTTALREQLLRISGALRVLSELLEPDETTETNRAAA